VFWTIAYAWRASIRDDFIVIFDDFDPDHAKFGIQTSLQVRHIKIAKHPDLNNPSTFS